MAAWRGCQVGSAHAGQRLTPSAARFRPTGPLDRARAECCARTVAARSAEFPGTSCCRRRPAAAARPIGKRMPPARLSPGPTLAQPPTIELQDYDTAGTTVRGGRASSRVMTLGLARTRDLPSPLSRLAGELPDAGPQPTRRE